MAVSFAQALRDKDPGNPATCWDRKIGPPSLDCGSVTGHQKEKKKIVAGELAEDMSLKVWTCGGGKQVILPKTRSQARWCKQNAGRIRRGREQCVLFVNGTACIYALFNYRAGAGFSNPEYLENSYVYLAKKTQVPAPFLH